MARQDSAIQRELDDYGAYFSDPATPVPTLPCDLIMQGGVASGVVYPLAIMEIAKKHELRGVGGTSAGAIGAVVAAAAEYGRRRRTGTGYAQLAALSKDILDKGIGRLFQPTAGMAGPFDLLVALQSRGAIAGVLAYVGTYWPVVWLAGALGFLNIGWLVAGSPPLAALVRDSGDTLMILGAQLGVGLMLFMLKSLSTRSRRALDGPMALLLAGGLLWAMCDFFLRYVPGGAGVNDDFFVHMGMAALAATSAMIFVFIVLLTIDLLRIASTKHRFGVCSGRTEAPRKDAALMEWLHHHVQAASGAQAPLTFGDLEATRLEAELAKAEGRPFTPPVNTNDIELRMTVTDLGLRRPHTLPFLPPHMQFVPNELAQVLPQAVVDAMYDAKNGDPAKSHPLPPWHKLPVLFAVRMSLCYPVLFRMVPLYHRSEDPHGKPERTLFTDGGICSNFPIHFYDGLLPSWPTLAIALEPSADPNRGSVKIDRSDARPKPRRTPASLADALGLIFQTAGGWRDQVQTSLPGYRERVCVVGLTKKQGGFDFEMARRDIASAMFRGKQAGVMLCGRVPDPLPPEPAAWWRRPAPQAAETFTPFDEAEHRYRRFLVAYARLEETLGALASMWKGSNGAWSRHVTTHVSPEFPQAGDKGAAIAAAVSAIDTLADVIVEPTPPLRMRYDVPEPPTNLRVTPRE